MRPRPKFRASSKWTSCFVNFEQCFVYFLLKECFRVSSSPPFFRLCFFPGVVLVEVLDTLFTLIQQRMGLRSEGFERIPKEGRTSKNYLVVGSSP